MPEYDTNLPQEFAHMPKKRGLRPFTLIILLIAVFVLGGLFANLRHQAPSGKAASSATVETSAEPPAAPAAD